MVQASLGSSLLLEGREKESLVIPSTYGFKARAERDSNDDDNDVCMRWKLGENDIIAAFAQARGKGVIDRWRAGQQQQRSARGRSAGHTRKTQLDSAFISARSIFTPYS